MLSQPDPVKQAAQQATIAKTQAEAAKLNAEAGNAQTKGDAQHRQGADRGHAKSATRHRRRIRWTRLEQIARIKEKRRHRRAQAGHRALDGSQGQRADAAADHGRERPHQPRALHGASTDKMADRHFEGFHRVADRERQAQDIATKLQIAREKPKPTQGSKP